LTARRRIPYDGATTASRDPRPRFLFYWRGGRPVPLAARRRRDAPPRRYRGV